MKLSDRQRSDLSTLDRVLSQDDTLRAVADLFPGPAHRSTTSESTPPRAGARRWPLPMRLAVLGAAAGLILSVITAPIGLTSLAAIGIALWFCGGVVFVTSAIRRSMGTTANHDEQHIGSCDAVVDTPREARHDTAV